MKSKKTKLGQTLLEALRQAVTAKEIKRTDRDYCPECGQMYSLHVGPCPSLPGKGPLYSMTITSHDLNLLHQFHSWLVEDGEQQFLVYDPDTGTKAYYPNIEWNTKDREDLTLHLECDYKSEAD